MGTDIVVGEIEFAFANGFDVITKNFKNICLCEFAEFAFKDIGADARFFRGIWGGEDLLDYLARAWTGFMRGSLLLSWEDSDMFPSKLF